MYRHTAFALTVCTLLATSSVHAGSATITPGNPHKLNITVNTDFEDDDIERWHKVFESASKSLYDATEGQMQLGKVKVFNNCAGMIPRSDVIIMENKTGANFSASMFGKSGTPVHKSPEAHIHVKKDADQTIDPGMALAHEIGHYIFAVHDEYQGTSVWVKEDVIASPLPVHINEDHYCSGPDGDGLASIMNAGSNVYVHKSEFCTGVDDGWDTSHHTGHIASLGATDADGKTMVLLRVNNQQIYRKMSAWEWIASSSPLRLGISMKYPSAEPTHNAGGSAIEWEVNECSATLVLVIDRSGSMSGGGLPMAKVAANNVIHAIPDGAQLGIISFSSGSVTMLPIAVVDDAVRDQAKLAVALLTASGGTNIGGALMRAYDELVNRPERNGGETVLLLSDGEHTSGTDPKTVIPLLRAEGIEIDGVGLGAADMTLMNEMSAQTGGESRYVATPAGLPKAMTDLALSSQGNELVRAEAGQLAPGESAQHEAFVDTLSEDAVFSMSTLGVNTTLSLRDPDGLLIDESNPSVELLRGEGGKAVRVNAPKAGMWKIEVAHPSDAVLPTGYTTEVYARSVKVSVSASLSTPLALYPHPTIVRAVVLADGNHVAGASVHAEVRDLLGNGQTIELFDDGQAGHGDDVAGDGIYGALFAAYQANGVYSVVVRVDNESGHSAVFGPHDNGEAESRPVPRFQREKAAFLAVLGVPDVIEPNSLALRNAASQARAAIALEGDVPNMAMLNFAASTSEGEYVKVSTLSVRDIGDGDMANVRSASLWIDGNGDGFPDFEGEHVVPIATAQPTDRSFTFVDVTLPPDGDFELVVSYDVSAPEAQDPEQGTVALPPQSTDPWRSLPLGGLMLLALGLVFRLAKQTQPRRRWARSAVAVGAVCLLASACADDGAETKPPAGSEPGPEQAGVVHAYQLELSQGETSALGLTSGETVAVDDEAVQGPLLEVSP